MFQSLYRPINVCKHQSIGRPIRPFNSSVHRSVYSSACLSNSSTYPSVHPSILPSIRAPVRPSKLTALGTNKSAIYCNFLSKLPWLNKVFYLSILPSIHPSINPSIYPFVPLRSFVYSSVQIKSNQILFIHVTLRSTLQFSLECVRV